MTPPLPRSLKLCGHEGEKCTGLAQPPRNAPVRLPRFRMGGHAKRRPRLPRGEEPGHLERPEGLMPRGDCSFRQRDVTALLRAVRDAGYERARLVVEPKKLILETSLTAQREIADEPVKNTGQEGLNEWDEVLSDRDTPKAS